MTERLSEATTAGAVTPGTPHNALRIIERSLREASQRKGHSGDLEADVEKSLGMLWDLVVLGHVGQPEPDDRDQGGESRGTMSDDA